MIYFVKWLLLFRRAVYKSCKYSFRTKPESLRKSSLGSELITRTDSFRNMTTVLKSPNDPKQYRVIQLTNEFRALLISDECRPIENGNVSYGDGESSLSGVPKTADDLEETDASAVADGDSDSCWTDVSSSEESDGDVVSSDAAESDDSTERTFSGGFHGGQHHKRSRLKSKDCGNEKLAAAGLCIGVGSFYDPPELPGLAHFLEHMVFMGSEKYPNDNDFDTYLSQHGGSSNAYTECEQTVFHFDVQKQYLHGALDRFAQFFMHPLLKKDSIDREIEAVDSEFLESIPSDSYRVEQLLGSLANKGHPMSKFMWGNKKTLKQQPSARRIDLYGNLKSFYKQYYQPQYMTLTVLSQDSLDVLENWVREIFSPMEQGVQRRSSFDHLSPPFENKSFAKLYKVVPVKTINQVIITWALPSQLQHYRVKPLSYLGWLVGHEGKGSIASYLKERNWGIFVESGNGETGLEHNTTCACFSVIITLSDEGFNNLHQVVSTVFEYINMIQLSGPKREIYDEISKLEEIDFRFQEPEDPQDLVEELCHNMQLFEADHFLTGNKLLMKYDEQVIRDCIDALTADKANIMILSNQFAAAGCCHSKEKWYKTPYCSEDIPQELLVKWSVPAVNNELFLPAANPYIAEDFDLKADQEEPSTKSPVIIRDTAVSRLWFKKDSFFKVPRVSQEDVNTMVCQLSSLQEFLSGAYANFYFVSASSNDTARSMCMTELFVQLLIHNLSEVVYDAELAQISYDVKVYDCGVLLKFGGFNDKLHKLFHLVVDHIAHFDATGEQFDVVKRDLETVYLNQMMKPEKLNNDIRLSLLQHTHWTMAEKYAELASVGCASLLQFVKDFFSSVYVEGLVQGNISVEDAKSLEHYLLTKFNIKPESPTVNYEILVTQLPPSSAVVFRTKNRNEGDGNCVITNYYQHGPGDVDECIKMELLMVYMEEPCFDYLRTRKQLGYGVGSEIRVTRGILGYTITICGQSSKHTVKHLDEQIECFLVGLGKRVATITDSKYNKMVSSLIKTKLIEDYTLSDEVDRNWAEIFDRTYLFDRRQHEIDSLKKLSLEDFKNWSAVHILASDQRKKLSIQVTGNKPCTGTSLKRNGAVLAGGRKKMTCRRSVGLKVLSAAGNSTEPNQSAKNTDVIYMDDVDKFRTQFAVCYPSSKIGLESKQ